LFNGIHASGGEAQHVRIVVFNIHADEAGEATLADAMSTAWDHLKRFVILQTHRAVSNRSGSRLFGAGTNGLHPSGRESFDCPLDAVSIGCKERPAFSFVQLWEQFSKLLDPTQHEGLVDLLCCEGAVCRTAKAILSNSGHRSRCFIVPIDLKMWTHFDEGSG
jgi:hypothetical protein